MSFFYKKVDYTGVIKAKRQIAQGIWEFIIIIKDQDFSFQAGQYVWLDLPELKYPDLHGSRRAFSISSAPNSQREISILFKVSGSGFKKSLLDLSVGKELRVIGPFGSTFVLPEKVDGDVYLVAGGTGIASFLSIIRDNFCRGFDKQRIVLVYLAKNNEEILYKGELEKIAKTYSKNFVLITVISRYFVWDDVKKVVKNVKKGQWWICGLQNMVDFVTDSLLANGVNFSQMRFEQFYPTPSRHDNKIKKLNQELLDSLELDWSRKIFSFDKITKDSDQHFFFAYLPIAISFSFILALVRYLQGVEFSLYVFNALLCLIFVPFYFLNKKKLLSILMLSLLFFVFVYPLFDSNYVHMAEYWTGIFPLIAFLLSKKWWKYYGTVYLLTIVLTTFLSHWGLADDLLVLEDYIQIFLSTCLVCVLIYFIDITYSYYLDQLSRNISISNLFRKVVESSTNHMIITDYNGVIKFANKAAEQMTGFSITEMTKETPRLWGALMPKDTYVDLWQKKLKGQAFLGEVINRRKTGEQYYTLAHIDPLKDDAGEVFGFIGAEEDITKLKEIDKAKTEFVSLASHQLRTPLSTINWYTEMLMNGDVGKLKKEQANYLGEIYRGSQRMVELVNSLLNISRLEMGTFKTELKVVDITKLADHAVDELALKIAEKKIKFHKFYDKNLPQKMMLDERIKLIIFQNLLSNAIKYTPTKGTVKLKLKKEKNNIEIIVTDSGIGIPLAEQDKIFTKLFRADNARAFDTDGNGLGLYMVKKILENLGGKIWFESKENKGTTFYVVLPINKIERDIKN